MFVTVRHFLPFAVEGMIDPMTGEGIHHAMEGGKIAAEFLGEAFEMGNFSKEVMKSYQDRWMTQFGHDYKWLVEFMGDHADSVYKDVLCMCKQTQTKKFDALCTNSLRTKIRHNCTSSFHWHKFIWVQSFSKSLVSKKVKNLR